jgi:DNA-binding NtrC family response regulator
MRHPERVGGMSRVLLVTKNRPLGEFCRKNLPEGYRLKIVAQLNLRTESAHSIIVFDSDYLTGVSDSVIHAAAQKFGAKEGAASLNILMNEENKARTFSLFPESLPQIQAILHFSSEAGKIAGLAASEWRWFLDTQSRFLKQLSDRALTLGENELLAERLARLGASPQNQVQFPPFMHGKSQAIVHFREQLYAAASRQPYLFLTGKADIPTQEFIEYYASLLRPEEPVPFQHINLAKLPKHLHAQAMLTAKKKTRAGRTGTNVLCVENLHLLGWQNQATLLTLLKNPAETRLRYVFLAPHEIGQLVRRGSFRQELYSLLRKAAVELPPLYDRTEDLSQIAAEYIQKRDLTSLSSDISAVAGKILSRFDLSSGYRGLFTTIDLMNDLGKSKGLPVFELMHTGKTSEALVAAQSFLREEIEPDPATLFENLAGGAKETLSLDFVESNYIAAVCQRYAWQVTEAARHLGISRKTLYDKMRRYKIARPENQARGKARKAS